MESVSVDVSSVCHSTKTPQYLRDLERERFTDWSHCMPVVDWLRVCSTASESSLQTEQFLPENAGDYSRGKKGTGEKQKDSKLLHGSDHIASAYYWLL